MQRRERRIRKTANKKRTIEKEGNMLHGGGNEKRVDYESSTGKQLEVRPSVVVRAKSLQTSQSILAYDEERNNETDDEDENEEDNEEINASFETAAHRSVEYVAKSDENEQVAAASSNAVRNNEMERDTMMMPRFAISFRDVEESIRSFDGTNTIPVEVWIKEYEEQATLMQWNEFQKFLFGKKALKGIAKLFVLSERGLNSWNSLKQALLTEFKSSVTSKQIHEQLTETKRGSNECVFEFFYKMKDIASRGEIADDAFIQHGVTTANARSLQSNVDITRKEVAFDNKKCIALFDTGSKFNVIREDFYCDIGKPKLESCSIVLVGFGNDRDSNKIKPVGHFKRTVLIDDEEFLLDFYVVPTRFVDVKLIIGEELCLLAEIVFNRNGLQVRKMSSSDELINMMKIRADVDNDVFDINEAASESAKREVRELMNNYVPNKTKSTNVEMRIVLNDESPIFSRVFQRHVNAIFRHLSSKGIALPYVDDVIIPAKTEEEAVHNLKEVIETCKEYGLELNMKKCNFLKTRIQFLGPLDSTHKDYKHILAVIDSFTKYCWLYPTKSTTANEVITKLSNQSIIFGNPAFIISDRGSAFTSQDFVKYCDDEGIKLVKTTTGLPRVNGQVERLNAIIISVLSKLSIDDPTKWYKHVGRVQQAVNSTFTRSIDTTPFEMLVGVKMRTKEDLEIRDLINKEAVRVFNDERSDLRAKAKAQIVKLQSENKMTYNLRRKPARRYDVGDLVAIKRTQFGSGLKLKAKFLGPYQVVKVKHNNSYDVQKVGNSDGPKNTTTCAEYMKPWSIGGDDDDDDDAFGPNA
ncbi:hypothetical protein ACLKA7_007645 [Drosophila subpalustris]